MDPLPSELVTQRNHILVVDDLPDNCLLLQTILEDEGYQVAVAHSGADALAQIATHPPDLILLDVMMPDMSGFEVTQHIRQNPNLPWIPILLVTGYSDITPTAGLATGADGFLRKPINFTDLLQRVRAIL